MRTLWRMMSIRNKVENFIDELTAIPLSELDAKLIDEVAYEEIDEVPETIKKVQQRYIVPKSKTQRHEVWNE